MYQDFAREWTAAFPTKFDDVATHPVDSLYYARGGVNRGASRYGRFLWGFVTMFFRAVPGVIIHAGGPGEWESLKHSTQTMFQPDSSLLKTDVPVSYLEDSGALSKFIHALAANADTLDSLLVKDGREPVAIHILAHSMGTIIASELLRHDTHLPITRIVFMAAACRVHDFFDVIVPYLGRHPETRFYNLMLHDVHDLHESCAGPWGSFLFRGSLLTWIDDFLSTQQTPLDRTLGRNENALPATRFVPNSLRSRVMFKTFGDGGPGDGTRTAHGTPVKHGDFSKPALHFWETSFWTPPGAPMLADTLSPLGDHHH